MIVTAMLFMGSTIIFAPACDSQGVKEPAPDLTVERSTWNTPVDSTYDAIQAVDSLMYHKLINADQVNAVIQGFKHDGKTVDELAFYTRMNTETVSLIIAAERQARTQYWEDATK